VLIVQAHYLVTALLYFGYMFVISFAMFLLTGCIGATSSLWFCSKIYSSIKVD
jgi:transmembrane 9 superfamily protein 2/4